jgi:hypothetical protein
VQHHHLPNHGSQKQWLLPELAYGWRYQGREAKAYFTYLYIIAEPTKNGADEIDKIDKMMQPRKTRNQVLSWGNFLGGRLHLGGMDLLDSG